MLNLTMLEPGSGRYVQQLAWSMSGSVRLELFRAVLVETMARHECLRAYFGWNEQAEPRLFVARSATVALEVREPNQMLDERPDEVIASFLAKDRIRGFDLSNPPLWRISIFIWEGRPVDCVWSFHHALLDGRAHCLLVAEILTQYAARNAGQAVELPPAHPFTEFLKWHGEQSWDAAADYWACRLKDFIDSPSLPNLAANPEDMGGTELSDMEMIVLDETATAALRAGARQHGVTLNNLLQGAWALVLGRYNAVEDVAFGVVRAGRHWGGADPQHRLGLFINTVPFRVDTSPAQVVGAWLNGLREQQLAARVGERASSEQIREWAGLASSVRLWRSILMFEDADWHEELAGLGENWILHEKTGLLALAAYAGRRLTLTLEYLPGLHPAVQIQTVLEHLRRLLFSLADAADGLAISEIGMMTSDERQLVLGFGTGPPISPPSKPLVRWLEDQAVRMPNATAVEFQQSQLSYAELHGRANQLARRLLQLAAPRDRVCVVLDRSPTQVVAWLALLKAGIAYAPVDPASPVERLNFLLTDLEPSVVLTQCALAPRLPPGMARVICLDDPAELACLEQLAAEPLRSEPVLEDPACFLSTSGSTGLPKASILSYSNLEFIAQTFGEAFDVGRTDRVLQLSSMVFDFALGELILALRAGATLVMGQWIDLRPGPALAGFLVNHRITVLAATPSALRVTPPPAKSAVRLILFGGEMLSVKTVLDWSHRCRVSNTCGPSECSFWATRDECVADGQRTTIGRPVENCRVYVLDANLSLQPVGAPGEMFVGGAGVGLGYWNRPDLTTERFLADPFAGQPDARMYRTGDQVRWLADGRLEYLGRLDHQVKFRGVRLELGEIEATLQNHPGVQHAVVAVVDDRLEAWLVADEPQPAIDRISAWLADRLPMMCIPTEFHFLAEFPRTGSGKIERQALLTQTRAGSGCQPQLPAPRRFDPVLAEWSGVEMPFPRERSVVDIFRDQARTRPEATALEDETQLMSYRELDILSNRVAHRLIRAGLRAEETVALLLDPSCLFAVAALGVLKAGGSYLPIAVDTTAHRLAFLLADSGARLALVNSSDMDRCASWSGLSFPVDAAGSAFADESDAEPSMPASPDRKAYVIYTSGSTGQPKGVEIEHHSLTNLVCFYQRRLGLTPRDRTTMIASVSFDASVADLWPGLCAGGTVIIPPRSLITDIDGLIAWLAAKRATFAFVPTVLAELMLGRPWPPLMALRFFATGGETLRVRPPGGLPFTVLNTYGPTENTVDSTWSVVSPAGSEQRPPIGRPIDNVKVYVLDERGESSPCGVAGELYLGGEQVARGYLGRPDLTAQHFLPDPFASDPGARMYRTGDWVRWHSEGELEYLGRQDDQVQIRGQRVELGEIEHALGVHPAVRQACCRAIQDDDTVTGVVAHVVPLPNQPDLQDQLRLYLANRLPAAMVPTAFVFHEFFPVTQQGKVDRGSLDAAAVPTRQCAGMVPPSDGIDRGLARIWEEMFPHGSEMNAETRFSALGGDSLLAVKLLLAVEELAGCRVAFSTFLLDPTLAGLSRAVKAQESANHPVVIALRRSGSRPPIFCIYDLSGDVGVYFDLADALGPDQPVFGVRSPALLNPEAVPQSMEAAAAEALRCIRQIQPTLAPVLVGYSWAGLLAFEVARQWMREETSIPLVCLLGTCAPLQQSTPASRLAHFIRWIPHWLHQWARDRGDRRRRLVNAAKRQVKGSMTPKASTPVPDWASTPLTREHILLARRYAPSVTHTLQVELFRERPDYMAAAHPLHAFATSHEPDGGWARWTGCPPRLYWIDSTHTSLFKAPAVGALAIAIRTAIDQYHGV